MRDLLLLLLLFAWLPPAASQPADPASLGAEYSQLLSAYADDPSRAVRTLVKWMPRDVERAIVQLPLTSAGAALRAGEDRAQRFLERMALLHFETAFAHFNRNDGDAMGAHLEWSRRIVRHALPWPSLDRLRVPAIEPGFHIDWALTIAGFFHTRLAFAEARRFLDEELRLNPTHGSLLLARGITEEIAASERALPRAAAMDSNAFPGRQALRSAEAIGRAGRAALESAATFYRKALSADPSLHEARLRLGRVLFDLGENRTAELELERAQALDLRPEHEYLVSLFRAALHERNGRTDEAVQCLTQAAALFPASQAPYLGLSQLRALNDPAEAGEILQQMFGRSAAPTAAGVPDPWWLYDAGFGASLPARLERLRAEARTP